MKKYKKEIGRELNAAEIHFIERLSKESWIYIKTVINTVREPVLILDKDLRVMAANESFYRMFQVDQIDTEHTLVYELGNGQWNIPALRKLLEEILPQNKFFKDFDVVHDFPVIGEKSMLLNARQIHFTEDTAPEVFPPIILLAIEDITPMMAVAETLAVHVKELAAQNAGNTLRLEMYINKLEKEIRESKERL
jgi:nitrogen-specific signal transduction histidine kinase